ncbi:MAG: hypothetical protein JXJ04_14925 [Spirochaetales bacterium]|nr:hypothetical protein [Spirochaetales bacterium]
MNKTKWIMAGAAVCLVVLFAACELGVSKVPPTEGAGLTVTGGAYEILTGEEAGASVDTMPKAKSIMKSEEEAIIAAGVPGLYLVDLDYIPKSINETLSQGGITLLEDGTVIDENGEETVVIFNSEIIKVTTEASGKGTPYAFAYYGWDCARSLPSGFCRTIKAWTRAYAYGPDGVSPTYIEYIYTHVNFSGLSDTDSANNVKSLGSYKEKSLGCGWPAYGVPIFYHRFYMKDGSIIVDRSFN